MGLAVVGCLLKRYKCKRAGDGTRTHDNDVGNVVLYHLSYTRPNRHRHAYPRNPSFQPRGPDWNWEL